MEERKIEELEQRSSLLFELEQSVLTRKLEAQAIIHNEIESMRREEKVLALSEEEVRLLRAFRGFKARAKPGGVFEWQTRPDAAVILPPETQLITDAQDAS